MNLSRMITKELKDRLVEIEAKQSRIKAELEALKRLQKILGTNTK